MRFFKAKAFTKLARTLAAAFVLTVAIGQGCGTSSALNEIEERLGIQKALGNGNGGGYGGMLPGNGGGYGGLDPDTDPRTPEAGPEDAGFASSGAHEYGGAGGAQQQGGPFSGMAEHVGPKAGWYHFGPKRTDGVCARYPNYLKQIGPYVYGLITWEHRRFHYQTSACKEPSQIANSSVKYLQFDAFVALYNDDIHLRLVSYFPRVADISEPSAYCTSSETDAGRHVGISVLVYRRGLKTYATIAQGKRVDAQFFASRVKPFVVSEERTASDLEARTAGFELKVRRLGGKKTDGEMDVHLDGERRRVFMTCILNEP